MNTSKTIKKIKSLFEKEAAEKLPHNIPLLLRARAEAYPDYTLQIVKNEVGEYEHYSYKRVYNRVVETACALQKIGVTRGAFIGLMCDNRREWFILDHAILSLGATDIPRGLDSTGTEMAFILNFIKCEICIFENQKQLQKLFACGVDVPTLKTVILIDSPTDDEIKKQAKAREI